jgi:hypothetical protein
MPVFLQPVNVPERCFLGEVLLWAAFQRVPLSLYDLDGREVRDTTEADEVIAKNIEWKITDEETKRAGIPPDPDYRALVEDRPSLRPSFYDDLLKHYDPAPDERLRIEQERASAAVFERECEDWQVHYRRAIEYPSSQIFVALKGGQLGSTGRLVPGGNMDEAWDLLRQQDKNIFDFPVVSIPGAFWSLSGIDFQESAAGNGSEFYCHVACKTAEMFALFPGERVPITGVERVGDSFLINDANRNRPNQSARGRPAYPWEPFHLEVAALLQRGELPSKKEAAIQHFQTWFEANFGIEPSRAAIGERLKPYYDKFGKRGGQKISG